MVSVLVLQGRLDIAEVTLFDSSSSGVAHHPDSYACVHCRLPELALLEEVWSLRLGSHDYRQHRMPSSSMCVPSTSGTVG